MVVRSLSEIVPAACLSATPIVERTGYGLRGLLLVVLRGFGTSVVRSPTPASGRVAVGIGVCVAFVAVAKCLRRGAQRYIFGGCPAVLRFLR